MTSEELQSDKERRALDLELYKIAAQTRALEIGFFWQRSNYLLVLNTAIAAGLVSLKTESMNLAIPLSLMGMLVSGVWLCINIGGKFWQCRWEQCVEEAERRVAPEATVFAAGWQLMENQVRENCKLDPPNLTLLYPLYWLRLLHRELIYLRPSVSEMITLLSLAFLGFWLYQVAT